MDEVAARRSAAARKAWVTRREKEAQAAESYGEERCQELLQEAKVELEEAERKYKATKYLVDSFRRLKEEAKKPATVGVVLLACFMLTATHAQMSLEPQEEYPLSREVAYESVAFMMNEQLRGGPGISDELMQGIRNIGAAAFLSGWRTRAAVEECGRHLSDRQCAEMLKRQLRDAGF